MSCEAAAEPRPHPVVQRSAASELTDGPSDAPGDAPGVERARWVARWVAVGIAVGLVLVGLSLVIGPTGVGAEEVTAWWLGADDPRTRLIVMELRLPRTLLALGVGAALGLSGALLQGLFRNPLADPGLIGVSAGAAVGAAVAIACGAAVTSLSTTLAAFVGGLATVALVWRIGRRDGRVSVSLLLLAGIAVNAVCGAALGAVIHVASDQELRALTSWTLGALGHATLSQALGLLGLVALSGVALPWFAQRLDALLLGDENARALGVNLKWLKRAVVALSALLVAVAVAASGLIGFVGLVAPHLIRLALRPLHRVVLGGSILLGGLLLLGADIIARTVAAPQEVPVGVVMALLGGPFFLLLIARAKREAL